MREGLSPHRWYWLSGVKTPPGLQSALKGSLTKSSHSFPIIPIVAAPRDSLIPASHFSASDVLLPTSTHPTNVAWGWSDTVFSRLTGGVSLLTHTHMHVRTHTYTHMHAHACMHAHAYTKEVKDSKGKSPSQKKQYHLWSRKDLGLNSDSLTPCCVVLSELLSPSEPPLSICKTETRLPVTKG